MLEQSIMTQNLIAEKFPDYANATYKSQAIHDTETSFRVLKSMPQRRRKWSDLLYRPLLTKSKIDYTVSPPVTINEDGSVRPYWKGLFDQSVQELAQMKVVSVLDFGAIGDGVTDCTAAFRKALGNGMRTVFVPAGIYRTRGIELSSYSALIGESKEETVLVLADDAPKKERLITNRNHFNGNHHIKITNLTLDWNIERLVPNERSSAGGTMSSGITLAHVQFALVHNVKIENPGLHGVDVTAVRYNYFGDGRRSVLGSRFVWIDEVEVEGFGDDGITTHHSDDILITNSYLHHPSGRAHKKDFSNSNGIEVDDGSQHVVLANNRTAYCFGGVEIKAHETSSAASDTQIIGHYSEKDNRSFNFRHIGHHQGDDLDSQSAYGIRASYLVSISPQPTDLYVDSTPRALVISAYQKVVVNQICAQAGKAEADPIAISVQYRAHQVSIQNVYLEEYESATKPIRIAKNTSHIAISK